MTKIWLTTTMIFVFLSTGCTRPLLVEGVGPSATVRVENTSTGYVQLMYFEKPLTCEEPHLIGYTLHPGASRSHKIPAGKLVTFSTSAWGLPSPPSKVRFCPPIFLSTKFEMSETYDTQFWVDLANEKCGIRILNTTSKKELPWVQRKGKGPAAGSGELAGEFSCEPSVDIQKL